MKDKRIAEIYICPVCRQILGKYKNFYQCSNAHLFDIAREGYVNLLLANQKGSKDPGDNKQMVESRRLFLSKGYYDQLIILLAKTIKNYQNKSEHSLRIFDAGCGEGHVLWKLKDELDGEVEYWGIDISKHAIKFAAKRNEGGSLAVASTFNIPVLSESVDFVLNIFAPGEPSEFSRVIRDSGFYLFVGPGPNHLLNLKKHIYDKATKHIYEEQILDSFKLVDTKRERHVLELSSKEDIANLLAMTPYYWHADSDAINYFSNLENFSTEVDFILQVFQKEN